jgi:hypothetical protein
MDLFLNDSFFIKTVKRIYKMMRFFFGAANHFSKDFETLDTKFFQ